MRGGRTSPAREVTRPEPAVRDGSLPLRRMTAQRSNEHFEVGQQLYAVLEAIKKPVAL